MDDLVTDFIAESREMLEAIRGALLAWEAEPSDRARLAEIFRFVHTIKGNCGLFGLARLKALSDAAEEALAQVRSGKRTADPQLVGGVLAVIDRISELVSAMETGEALAIGDDISLIQSLLHEDAPGPAPSAVTAMPAPVRSSARTVRLPVDLLDRMMQQLTDLMEARNRLHHCLQAAKSCPDVINAFDRLSDGIIEMRDAALQTRMQRIETLFAPLPRMIRELSGQLGKPCFLELHGGEVEADREMIEMIRDPMLHIIRNAIDHGIEPAEDRLAAGKPLAGRIRINARREGNQISIDVEDDGKGIDEQELVRKAVGARLITVQTAAAFSSTQRIALMFEPGLSTARTVTAISGRGVGMDVVRANIEGLGGRVETVNRPGQGVCIRIEVPFVHPITQAQDRFRRKTCLVVDDSRVLRKVASHILETLHFSVDEAEDGRVALARCEADMPDLVLLDWNMPVMGGIEFLQKLRKMKDGRQPKVVFCSTESGASHIRAARSAGADEYVMKPFDRDLLRSKLQVVGMA